jgi:hypothetical protein
VEQGGQHRRGTVTRVARGQAPPRRADHAGRPHLVGVEAPDGRPAGEHALEALDGGGAAHLAQDLEQHRQVLDGVAVGVDDRVVELGADGLDGALGHGPPPAADGGRRRPGPAAGP